MVVSGVTAFHSVWVGTASLRSWQDTEGNSKGLTDKSLMKRILTGVWLGLRGVQQGEGRGLPEPRKNWNLGEGARGQEYSGPAGRHLGVNTPSPLSFLPVSPISQNNQQPGNKRAWEMNLLSALQDTENRMELAGGAVANKINCELTFCLRCICWVTMLS